MDKILCEKILGVTRRGKTRREATDFFRVALGLIYLDAIMTDEKVDFKHLDKLVNRFIYRSVGQGHSITSILQFMSGNKVLPILNSKHFITAFSQYCNEVPLDKIPALLAVNLAVAKQLSKLGLDGELNDWIIRHQGGIVEEAAAEAAVIDGGGASPDSPAGKLQLVEIWKCAAPAAAVADDAGLDTAPEPLVKRA